MKCESTEFGRANRYPFTSSHAIVKIVPDADRILLVAKDTPFAWEDEPTAVHVSELRRVLAGLTEERRGLVIRTGEGDHLALSVRRLEPVPWVNFDA
jgi:hypothetical protein